MARRKAVKIEAEPAEPTECCKSCRCGWMVESEETVAWYCRLNPPTVTFDYEEGTQVSSFPFVAPDLWCSHFTPKLNS